MPEASFLPQLSASTQAFFRAGYGLLMMATLVQALPEARRFFLSERWGGYARSSRDVDAVQNPMAMPLLMAIWFGAAVALVAGWASPWPALVNLILCRYFFIHMRWKSVLRGLGAPGFMAYWAGLAVFLLEYTSRFAPELRALALLVLQVDLALVMLSAGIYKVTAGYPRNHGMELGLCNPMWGYWWKWYAARPPSSPIFWAMNQLAWGTEVVAALLMLVPATRELGALLLIGSFLFILTQIRLGFLCEMVALCGLLYIAPGGTIDRWTAAITDVASSVPVTGSIGISAANAVLGVALWGYLIALPFAHAGLYYNFYARRSLPGALQRVLERYTNLFGLIIWRVFSVDLVNFFIRVWREPREGGVRVPVSRPGPLYGSLRGFCTRCAVLVWSRIAVLGARSAPRDAGNQPRALPQALRVRGISRAEPLAGSWPRFNHVGEMICLTSLFTTLKYYPGNDAIFHERLLRYARTLPRESGDVLIFEYVSVVRRSTHFDWVTVAHYRVDVEAGTVVEQLIDESFSPRAAHAVSPVHEGTLPGSYAPASR